VANRAVRVDNSVPTNVHDYKMCICKRVTKEMVKGWGREEERGVGKGRDERK